MSYTASDTLVHDKLDEPKLWQVVLHNDDFTPMDFVEDMLMHVFGKGAAEATALTMKVHTEGRAIVDQFSKEVAVAKATYAMQTAETLGHPLLITAEPVP